MSKYVASPVSITRDYRVYRVQDTVNGRPYTVVFNGTMTRVLSGADQSNILNPNGPTAQAVLRAVERNKNGGGR